MIYATELLRGLEDKFCKPINEVIMTEPKHPMQPIVMTPDGVLRFKENAIVKYMLDEGRRTGGVDLNKIALLPFSQNDNEQLAQLIGHSVSGYGGLSYVSEESVMTADLMCTPEYMKKPELEVRNELLRMQLKEIKTEMFNLIAGTNEILERFDPEEE